MLKELMSLAQPALFSLEPEKAHALTIKTLKSGIFPRQSTADDARLHQSLLGLEFDNPLGMAAGFDKNAEVPDALLQMGFGFSEIGTVTPKPQPGNPAPRVFRLIEDRALINRLGFNNEGHDAALKRLQARARSGVVGVNLGANKVSEDKVADYVAGIRRFYAVADYFTINISSPNTPGLRDLQSPEALADLLDRVFSARQEMEDAASQGGHGAHRHKPAILVKLAPDIQAEDLEDVAAQLTSHNVDGIVVSNTTLSRAGLKGSAHIDEAGGLSGEPLFERSTAMLGEVYRLTGGHIPLVGVGGISSAETAVAKMEAGASLLQLYTGMVYGGPILISQVKDGLISALERDGLTSLRQLTGRRAPDWAGKWADLAGS